MVSLRSDDVIYIVDPENIDISVAETIVNSITEIIKQLRAESKPVNILIDMSRVKNTSSDAKRYIVSAIKNLDFDAMTGFGKNSFGVQTANMMLMALRLISTDLPEKIKFFNNEAAAEKWLRRAI